MDGGFLITGVRAVHYVSPSGVVEEPVSPTARPLTVYGLTGSNFTPVNVYHSADGGFSFTVRQLPYYVGDGRFWVVSNSTSLDLGSSYQGRPGQVTASTGTPPTFTVTAGGLDPWQSYDILMLASESVFELGSLTNSGGSLAPGATALSAQPMSYSSVVTPITTTMEAAKGDTAVVTQVRTSSFTLPDGGPGDVYHSVVAAAPTGPINVSAGQNTSLSLTFSPGAQRSASLDWRGSGFAALSAQVHPQATLDSATFYVVAIPRHNTNLGWVGYLADLFTAYPYDLPDGTYNVSYRNPVSTWDEIASAGALFLHPIRLPGATQGGILASVGGWGPPATLFGAPISPALSPPRSLLLDGQGAQGAPLTLTSTTPQVSWSPPSIGAPTAYQVSVRELFTSPTNATRARSAGLLIVTATSVRLPPGLLQSGKSYVLVVTAEAASGGRYSPTSAPRYDWSSERHADAVTTQFSVP